MSLLLKVWFTGIAMLVLAAFAQMAFAVTRDKIQPPGRLFFSTVAMLVVWGVGGWLCVVWAIP